MVVGGRQPTQPFCMAPFKVSTAHTQRVYNFKDCEEVYLAYLIPREALQLQKVAHQCKLHFLGKLENSHSACIPD